MAKYKISEPVNIDKYEELVFISLNLRYWTKKWKLEYGTTNGNAVALYSQKMDKWIAENTELDKNQERLKKLPKFANNKSIDVVVPNQK